MLSKPYDFFSTIIGAIILIAIIAPIIFFTIVSFVYQFLYYYRASKVLKILLPLIKNNEYKIDEIIKNL